MWRQPPSASCRLVACLVLNWTQADDQVNTHREQPWHGAHHKVLPPNGASLQIRPCARLRSPFLRALCSQRCPSSHLVCSRIASSRNNYILSRTLWSCTCIWCCGYSKNKSHSWNWIILPHFLRSTLNAQHNTQYPILGTQAPVFFFPNETSFGCHHLLSKEICSNR